MGAQCQLELNYGNVPFVGECKKEIAKQVKPG